ncbi:hypothetical protein AG1IA_03337 [Rhizoctonia solani AG-1 IA]|uniref:Uncharacterized protein n=1 Tax=Thanatephorus cucumeris (strain AG1-IA) TaxID=983506 RepID=L8X0Q3_THACA|nr:hypothetical protein AG1IA_03337 [Rhizoctonia solani AG-1 IA]
MCQCGCCVFSRNSKPRGSNASRVVQLSAASVSGFYSLNAFMKRLDTQSQSP